MQRPTRQQQHFLFLNLGHLLDHLCLLIFATVAALVLHLEWGLEYADLITYATPGFIAFGAFALPAGWLADRWNREGMMTIFFIGIGIASISCALATTPAQMSLGLFGVGVFAAIYHPVGIALVLELPGNTGMRIAGNGVWGNMGVAVAALLTAFLIDSVGWRAAFAIPGVLSVLLGVLYWMCIYRTRHEIGKESLSESEKSRKTSDQTFDWQIFVRVMVIILFTTALGGLVFQSTTFALPKVLAERTASISGSATILGWLAFCVFAVGSMGQLVVGYLLDKHSARHIFMGVATLQVLFFTGMVSAHGWTAILMATGFMVAAFGQIPINDVLVGKVSRSEWRSRVLAVRYTVTITIMASAIPFIAWIHSTWGFGRLFVVLAIAASFILAVAWMLPKQLHTRQETT